MMQFPTWKIFFVIAVCAFGLVFSSPNLMGAKSLDWAKANLPGFFPTSTVNLGLDLRGGAHLLYEVDVDVVFKDRADLIVDDLRKEMREKKIGYRKLGTIPFGVRFTVRESDQAEEARRVLRKINSGLEVSSNGNEIQGVFTEAAKKEIFDQTLSQSIEIIRRRVDELGTTEPVIQRQGERRILIQAPGADSNELKQIIGKTAKLTFHLLPGSGASQAARTETLPMADEEGRNLTIYRQPKLTGDMLETAAPSFRDGQPVITFRFNNSGARKFCDITRENVQKPFAIVLDKEILTAPNIRQPICGGSGEISGNFTVQEASNLALLLRAGALPAPMKVVLERTVGPSLGADSVAAGKLASIIGLALVLVFMAVTYGLFGLFANVALMVNVTLIFALLSSLQATLTLPGIAGIVLTVGMAVDANVLIFERIREEFKSGRSAISSIDAGYNRAMATIVDSNLTTLIAAFILFSFGTGPIKGFAVTLAIGIVTSFFSAIMVTRLLVVMWYRRKRPSELPV